MLWSLVSTGSVPSWRPDGAASDTVLAFTTRRGGTSEPPYDTLNVGLSTADRPEAIHANRRRVLDSVGLDADRLATAGQCHGVAVAEAVAPGLTAGVDALVTRTRGLTIAVTCADCMPVLMTAPGAVAAAHAGWRGMAGGILDATLARLIAVAGARADAVHVHLGPSIRSCCFRVGPEVAERFPAEVVVARDGGLFVDLARTARLRLTAAGVPETSIHEAPACTACDPLWYFSHRRDGDRTGRMWGIAGLRP